MVTIPRKATHQNITQFLSSSLEHHMINWLFLVNSLQCMTELIQRMLWLSNVFVGGLLTFAQVSAPISSTTFFGLA